MSGFGGVVSLRTDTEARALALVQNTKLITLAESLGGVESLIDHPATMTHLAIADCELSIDGAFIRLSVGIEDIDDILADLDRALAATAATAGGAEGTGATEAADETSGTVAAGSADGAFEDESEEDPRRAAPAASRPTVASV